MLTRTPLPIVVARLLAAPAVAAVVLAGVWVAGGLITDDFTGSAVATGVWFALSAAAVARLAFALPAVRWAMAAGYVASALGVSLYLGWSMFNDRVVDEQVVVGTPMRAMPAPAAGDPAPRVNVEVAAGTFRSGEHETAGRAAVVRLPDGRRMLTLTRFHTSAGPDLRVRVVPGGGPDGGVDGAHDLGALKGNRGDQQYELPEGATVTGASVVIWCRAFSASFGHAVLRGA